MSILIRNVSDLEKELRELSYLDVKEVAIGLSKGNIYVYKKWYDTQKWSTTLKNWLIDFFTVGEHFLVLRVKPLKSPYLHIRREYASVSISGMGELRVGKMIEVLILVEKYEVSKIPVFDLDHLRSLGYKFVLKDEVSK